MELSDQVGEARRIAERLLSDALPRRWSHTIGVAETATRLARVLTPDWAEEIVAAAWLHDIGYAPDLADTEFHPIDGAAYLVSHQPHLGNLVGLVAHHTGAGFEAEERGLQERLCRYRTPVDVATWAILNCADLCTGPDGSRVDPAARIDEILSRYPAEHPVHRAITRSASLLISQARLVLGAAAAADQAPQVALPETVECSNSQWRAVWSGDHGRVTAVGQGGIARPSWVEINPPDRWEPAESDRFAGDLRAATDAADNHLLGWTQYRTYEAAAVGGHAIRSAEACALTSWGSTTSFYFDDVARLHLDMMTNGRAVRVQHRTFTSLSDVTDWTDLPVVFIDGPFDLSSRKAQAIGERVDTGSMATAAGYTSQLRDQGICEE
jgi:hypothetical protein